MNLANTPTHASPFPPGMLANPLDGASGVPPSPSRGIRYVADDHGLEQDINGLCPIHPHVLAKHARLALAS